MDEWKWKKPIHPINQWKWQNHPSHEWMKMKKPSILWMWIWKIYPYHEWMNENEKASIQWIDEWKWKSIHPMNGWMKMEQNPSIQSISENDRIMNRNDQNHPSYEWVKLTKSSIPWMNENDKMIHPMNEFKEWGLFFLADLLALFPGFSSPFIFCPGVPILLISSKSLTFLFHPSIHSSIQISLSLCRFVFSSISSPVFFSSSSSSSFFGAGKEVWCKPPSSLLQLEPPPPPLFQTKQWVLWLPGAFQHHPSLFSLSPQPWVCCCDLVMGFGNTHLGFLPFPAFASLRWLWWSVMGFGHNPSLFFSAFLLLQVSIGTHFFPLEIKCILQFSITAYIMPSRSKTNHSFSFIQLLLQQKYSFAASGRWVKHSLWKKQEHFVSFNFSILNSMQLLVFIKMCALYLCILCTYVHLAACSLNRNWVIPKFCKHTPWWDAPTS